MKIVFYISGLQTHGGAERALIGLANWFSMDNDVVIVAERGNRNEAAYQIDEKVKFINLENCLVEFPVRQLALLLSVRKVMKQVDPDIIVSFLALANTRLLASGVYKKHPVVVCERNDPKSDPSNENKRKQRDKFYRYADRIIVQTDEVKDYFERLGYKEIDVIPNFVNTIPYIEVERTKIFVSMGRLSNQKNQKWLIDAFINSRLHESGYKLVIYGNGELKEELSDFIKRNNANGYVELHSAIPNILEEINKAYCFILPSLYEGMPNALMEAMSMRLPCISTDCPCGGPRALIDSGNNGVLVELENQEQLIAAMKKVANDHEFSTRIAKNAYNIRTTHSIGNISKLWMNSFVAAIEKRRM